MLWGDRYTSVLTTTSSTKVNLLHILIHSRLESAIFSGTSTVREDRGEYLPYVMLYHKKVFTY